MLSPDATLIDVAFAVCTALDHAGERALLVGGSAATFYAPDAYQSSDCDFILALGPDARDVTSSPESVGFHRVGEGIFRHADLIYTVEFPKGPAQIGIDAVTKYCMYIPPLMLYATASYIFGRGATITGFALHLMLQRRDAPR
jgi:hypothetical protein